MDDAFASPGSSGGVDFDVRTRAQTCNTLGLIAVILSLVSPCSCYMTTLFALPLSLFAVHYGRTVLAEDPDEVAVAYARTGMTIGVVSMVYNLVIVLAITAYVLLYAGIIAAVVASEL